MAEFPSVEESDSDDVRWALETANTMWSQGDKEEALKWLKRAVDSAEEAGDDMRSLNLAKARAELHSLVEVEAPTPMPREAPLSGAPLSGAPPMSAPPPPVSSPPPLSTPPPSRPPLSHPPSAAPPPSPSAPPGPPPPRQSGTPRAPSRPAPPPARSSGPGAAPSGPSSSPHGPISSPGDDRPTLIQPSRGPLPMPTSARGFDERRALRVAVQPVQGQPGVFLTRPLKTGERPAPGAHEAILVAVDGGVDLLSGS